MRGRETLPKVPAVPLGRTGLRVSKLGFGTYDFGVPSLNISAVEGGGILAEAYKLGVNFWDASDDYGSHPHVALALKLVPRREVVISTKTSAKNRVEAEKSLRNSLKELGTDFIDVFLLHYVKSDWIGGCRRVLKGLCDLKTTGIVRAVGLSTHSVAVVEEASKFEEVDVIMAICCKAEQSLISEFHENIPLEDGSIGQMFQAIKLAHRRGKGVIAMKVLGTGILPLVDDYQSSIRSIAKLDFVNAMVIGMKSLDEVKKNASVILSG